MDKIIHKKNRTLKNTKVNIGDLLRLIFSNYVKGTIMLLLLFVFFSTYAQDDIMIPKPEMNLDSVNVGNNLELNLNLKNMHTWRGSVVTPGVMIASDIAFVTTNKKFTIGLWGGASFNGDYKEFSYFTKYSFSDNLFVEVVSHNNYSNEDDPDIFSYDKFTSPNFIDIGIGYTISDKIPLSAYWATILGGLGGDYVKDKKGKVTDSYSNYLELSYRIYQIPNTKFFLFAGGAFSFTTEDTFYSEKANIVNVGLSLEHQLKLFKNRFPVIGTAFWNPESKIGALQIDIKLF